MEDRLTRRLDVARRALVSLQALAQEPPSPIIRDASIQRFEYTFEAIWKAAQAVLRDRFGVELASPKPIIRASLENGLLDEEEARLALAMVDHRNLTAHTYDEALADEIFAALPRYRSLMQVWLERLARS
ncbi:nucleotidyltransferase substrate binding protein [Tepidimonas taiwanensis]|uniref:Nucleotidyltransferase substrate binding protein n=1 Tax=Tepidimonas taiwanensis TaxID=307486 RepID=A0A554X046_9BURK|nr:HI0074 family nucleotidyltransferase substrate-binding subunit [Tepidimonas taiwanensis]MCX7692570.1 nucleotidyltransferase substrate binding protein [Tepidimonas taiwanensis]MDM7462755.1 HI0074 family nucleotidyltransferase substrate-binding subunit [Tepidimonas taiwanensis]TSE29219.1 nucleotidyltransferase substrate binding protein [Tepidimonas taiwanensis]UBQ04651.1 nucleotidyltransferase substrate binding protein [Tepidimonas taiwanensis]